MSHRGAPIIKRRAGISDFNVVCSAKAFWQVTHAFDRMKYSAPTFEDERDVSCRGTRATDQLESVPVSSKSTPERRISS